MRVLMVTTAKPTPRLVAQAVRDLGLAEADLHLVSLDPPTKKLAVDRHLVVDRSVLPWRPVFEASTQAAKARPASGPGRWLRAGLRRGRSQAGRLPIPQRWRATPSRMLAIACRTSSTVSAWAAQADVVVALDDAACWGVWELARRSDTARYVHLARNVRQVLGAPRR